MRVMKVIKRTIKFDPHPKKTFWNIFLHMLKYPLGVQGVYDEAVHRKLRSLAFVSDHFKTEGMCNETVEEDPYTLRYVVVYLRTHKMCIKAFETYL